MFWAIWVGSSATCSATDLPPWALSWPATNPSVVLGNASSNHALFSTS